MVKLCSSVFLCVAASVLSPTLADDISLQNPSPCSGSTNTISLNGVTCTDCNFGEEATISASIGTGECPDSGSICVVATASAPVVGEERLFDNSFDCSNGDTDFSEQFRLPELPASLQSVAMATITVEMYNGDCEGGDLNGCYEITAQTTAVTVAKAAGVAVGVAAVAAAGVAAWKLLAVGGAAAGTAAAAGGSNFQKMNEDGVAV